MAKRKGANSKQLEGVMGVLQGANQVVIFQKNGIVKGYDNNLPVKRPNQYKRGK
jgi:hypothetical protein